MSRPPIRFIVLLLPVLFVGSGFLSLVPGPIGASVSVWAAEKESKNTSDPMDPEAFVGNGDSDPYQRLNKKVFRFNDGLDRYLFEPVARGYDFIMPSPLMRGVTNFFNNIEEPRIILNGLLQGKAKQAVRDTVRFAFNTTLGIGGLFDVAKHLGLERHDEDFGQTLAVWGAKESSYFVIPVLGPSSIRDTTGEIVDLFTYPLLYYHDAPVRWTLYGLMLVNRRANLLSATDVLSEAAGEDRYEFVRESYYQSRKNQIYDGNPPLDLPYMMEEEPGGLPPAGESQ